MNKINSFAIYREYWELITLLNEKEQSNVLMAVFKYMFEDEEIKLSEREKKVFVNLKRPLDKSKNKSNNARTKQNQKEIKNKSNENQNKIKSKSKGVTHQDVIVNVNDNVYVNNIYSYIEDNFGRTLSPIEYEMISNWEDNELTRYAVKEAVLNGKYNLKYIEAILNSFKKNNITSVQQAQNESKKFKNGNVPEWFDKKIEKETDEESSKELEEMLKEF